MTTTTTPIYGNYHGYYAKRPPGLSDGRLARLPAGLFKDAQVLDIGCNEGWVTCEIAQSCGAAKVVGVDIDDSLVQAAWRRRLTLWSLQQPSNPAPPLEVPQPQNGHGQVGKKRKRLLDDSSEDTQNRLAESPPLVNPKSVGSGQVRSYFPASCEHEFGALPIPPSAHRGKTAFPHNVAFRTADWAGQDILEDSADGYDVVIAFSISKWIHLNGGDEGLKHFFRKVHRVLKKGGTFVLEPQPWDSYAKAKRMSEKLKANAARLAIRPDDFSSVLQEIGFAPPQHLGAAAGDTVGGFNRPIDLYVKL